MKTEHEEQENNSVRMDYLVKELSLFEAQKTEDGYLVSIPQLSHHLRNGLYLIQDGWDLFFTDKGETYAFLERKGLSREKGDVLRVIYRFTNRYEVQPTDEDLRIPVRFPTIGIQNAVSAYFRLSMTIEAIREFEPQLLKAYVEIMNFEKKCWNVFSLDILEEAPDRQSAVELCKKEEARYLKINFPEYASACRRIVYGLGEIPEETYLRLRRDFLAGKKS